jgi:hypothetical protein
MERREDTSLEGVWPEATARSQPATEARAEKEPGREWWTYRVFYEGGGSRGGGGVTADEAARQVRRLMDHPQACRCELRRFRDGEEVKP